MSTEVQIFFNFRSPYCYLAAQSMFDALSAYNVELEWRPLSGWDGRSAPERAKTKLPIARQDVSRWCRRLGIPFVPPPVTTDPTKAALGSLAAARHGILANYVKAVMNAEWSRGQDIGDINVLEAAAAEAGLNTEQLHAAIASEDGQRELDENWALAQEKGVFGVPTFVVGDEIFWGNDRLDFLTEHLADLGLAR